AHASSILLCASCNNARRMEFGQPREEKRRPMPCLGGTGRPRVLHGLLHSKRLATGFQASVNPLHTRRKPKNKRFSTGFQLLTWSQVHAVLRLDTLVRPAQPTRLAAGALLTRGIMSTTVAASAPVGASELRGL